MPPPPPLPPPLPPPITPSPHRFLAPVATTNPFTSFRHQQSSQQPTPQTSSQQFAAAPKFSFVSNRKRLDDPQTSSSQASSPTVPRRLHKHLLTIYPREDVEEAASDRSEDEQPEDFNHENGLPNATFHIDNNSPIQPPSSSPPPNPKRRRLKPSQPADSDAIFLSSPPTSSSPQLSTIPKTQTLIITPPRPTPLVYNTQPSTQPQHPRFLPPNLPHTPSSPPSLPKFLLPEPPSPGPALPFPLSPSRKGHKYIPGGLASTLRDLVLETSLQASHYTRAGGPRSEGWDFRVGVEEVRSADWGQGMALLREKDGRGWVLMGKGMGRENVERGCVVGLRRPVWDVKILGESWAVGVEWRVLG